jgi:CBS domain containing-hemolysin-like protein
MEFFAFAILLALSAFFSSAETAYFSIRHSQLRLLKDKEKKNAALAYKLKNQPERLLFSILIGSNIVNALTASYATVLCVQYFGSIGLGIATGAVALLVLVFGEIIPKSFSIQHNTVVVRTLAQPLYFFYIIFYPIAWVLLRFHRMFSSFSEAKKEEIVSEEEIRTMSKLGAEHGAIDESEQTMIENVFRFDDVKVKDIMTPEYRMEILHGEVPIEQIAHFASLSGFSRFPVDDDGKIIGYIHVNRIMQALNSDERDEVVANFIKPIKSVSESMTVDTVFRSMQKEHTHMYLVHADDDKEEIVGLVTMENVLEEIVGEIKDETDD